MCKRAVDLTYGLLSVRGLKIGHLHCMQAKPNMHENHLHAGLELPVAHNMHPTHLAHDLHGVQPGHGRRARNHVDDGACERPACTITRKEGDQASYEHKLGQSLSSKQANFLALHLVSSGVKKQLTMVCGCYTT